MLVTMCVDGEASHSARRQRERHCCLCFSASLGWSFPFPCDAFLSVWNVARPWSAEAHGRFLACCFGNAACPWSGGTRCEVKRDSVGRRASVLDNVARLPSVHAIPEEFSYCFGSAACPWAAEPHDVEYAHSSIW